MFIHPHDITIAIMIVVVMAFIMIGHIYRETIQGPLKKPLFTINAFDNKIVFDWWSASHIGFYMVIGYLVPQHFWGFALMGAGFEAFEDFLSSDETTKMVNCSVVDKKTIAQQIWCNGVQDSYWYSKWDDIIVNMIGYAIGEYIATGKVSLTKI